MAAVAVIPARMGSTRFPAKILADRTGRPLVQHVVDQVRKCRTIRDIIVATDDPKIVEALRPFETRCVLTDPAHPSGTDRIAEVARGLSDELIVNVQGDEPEIEPQIIDDLVEHFEKSQAAMGTVVTPFPAGADVNNPNLVKCVVGQDGHAIYFSRAPIPYPRDPADKNRAGFLLHLGLYIYRKGFLLEFTGLKPTPLEQTEKLEQLRALEHGRRILVRQTERATHGIDTPEQYEEFVKRWKSRRSI